VTRVVGLGSSTPSSQHRTADGACLAGASMRLLRPTRDAIVHYGIITDRTWFLGHGLEAWTGIKSSPHPAGPHDCRLVRIAASAASRPLVGNQ
jgi:hypothetical protein